MLSDKENAIIASLSAQDRQAQAVDNRIQATVSSIGPAVDKFADGIHHLGRYRQMADSAADGLLLLCSQILERREISARARMRQKEDFTLARDSINGVLRSLSRLER